MIVTIKASKEVWHSPDGQRSVWDLETPTGETWQTMSRQIATAIGQSLDLTTRVSASGKTYLVKPLASPDGVGAPSSPGVAVPSSDDVRRFSEAVDRFQEAVIKFVSHTYDGPGAAPELPPIENYDGFGDERAIEDDL